jgi:hypothetical protein
MPSETSVSNSPAEHCAAEEAGLSVTFWSPAATYVFKASDLGKGRILARQRFESRAEKLRTAAA